MKIYTKTGDRGETSLLGGSRVPKYHRRINAYGTVDELNSFMGLVRDSLEDEEIRELFLEIQSRLFTIGSSLAAETDKANRIKPDIIDEDVKILEIAIDKMNEVIPPLRNFVLPGGHVTVSYCHVARTICRRAERLIIELSEHEIIEELVIKYINRLSDYLFVLARYMAHQLGVDEIAWAPRNKL